MVLASMVMSLPAPRCMSVWTWMSRRAPALSPSKWIMLSGCPPELIVTECRPASSWLSRAIFPPVFTWNTSLPPRVCISTSLPLGVLQRLVCFGL